MIKIKFLANYRGVLTRELFYGAGDIVEFDNHAAEELVAAGRAEYLEPVGDAAPDSYAVAEAEPEAVEPKAKKSKPKKKVKK